MSKICILTLKKNIFNNKVSYSNRKKKCKKKINFKKINFWYFKNFKKIKISSKSIKIIKKCLF
ncbi:ribosomal protein L28 [Candidatus Carsonella ruddii CS isolate Thao2000]|uniref:Ribosomal protein L28 n=1 Tax=Candidatus Carsonella ruddii CS isolate Thao2000 TaxID=1202537 RepID=J7H0F6_CARRU|nr:L28 family ribosomal protein [Candidatus Carsonella ruddii]AFP83790.1 ribosomal protein L28 [Candidatus Carsonella ruddii CS isolate Thao2000]